MRLSYPPFTMGAMKQMELITSPGPEWRLDNRTRQIGREGVAAAREALRRSADRRRSDGGRSEAA